MQTPASHTPVRQRSEVSHVMGVFEQIPSVHKSVVHKSSSSQLMVSLTQTPSKQKSLVQELLSSQNGSLRSKRKVPKTEPESPAKGPPAAPSKSILYVTSI